MRQIQSRKQTPPKISTNTHKNNTDTNLQSTHNTTLIQSKSNKPKHAELEPKQYYGKYYPSTQTETQTETQTQTDSKNLQKVYIKLQYKQQQQQSQTLEMIKIIYIQVFGQRQFQSDYRRFQKIQAKYQSMGDQAQYIDCIKIGNHLQIQQQQFNIQGKMLQKIIQEIKRLKEQANFHHQIDNSANRTNNNNDKNKSSVRQSISDTKIVQAHILNYIKQNNQLKQKVEQLSQQVQCFKQEIKQLQDQKQRLTHLNECKFKKIEQLKKQLIFSSDYIQNQQLEVSQLIQENQKLQTTLKIVQDEQNRTVLVMKSLEESVILGKCQNQNQLADKFKIEGFIWALQEIDNQIRILKLQNIEISSSSSQKKSKLATRVKSNDQPLFGETLKILQQLQQEGENTFMSMKSHNFTFQDEIFDKQYFN